MHYVMYKKSQYISLPLSSSSSSCTVADRFRTVCATCTRALVVQIFFGQEFLLFWTRRFFLLSKACHCIVRSWRVPLLPQTVLASYQQVVADVHSKYNTKTIHEGVDTTNNPAATEQHVKLLTHHLFIPSNLSGYSSRKKKTQVAIRIYLDLHTYAAKSYTRSKIMYIYIRKGPFLVPTNQPTITSHIPHCQQYPYSVGGIMNQLNTTFPFPIPSRSPFCLLSMAL